MNFSTVPPQASISARTRWKYGVWIARTSSGSSRSERAVKPTRSAKSTETIFRSSRALPWSAVRRVPQALQNFASGGFSRPQLGQTFTL